MESSSITRITYFYSADFLRPQRGAPSLYATCRCRSAPYTSLCIIYSSRQASLYLAVTCLSQQHKLSRVSRICRHHVTCCVSLSLVVTFSSNYLCPQLPTLTSFPFSVTSLVESLIPISVSFPSQCHLLSSKHLLLLSQYILHSSPNR